MAIRLAANTGSGGSSTPEVTQRALLPRQHIRDTEMVPGDAEVSSSVEDWVDPQYAGRAVVELAIGEEPSRTYHIRQRGNEFLSLYNSTTGALTCDVIARVADPTAR